MHLQEIPTQNILNPTGGFLKAGFTHTINLYRGCALANSLCGMYCYAQWNAYHTKGREWGGFLDVKAGFVEAYRLQYDRLKHPTRGEPKPLRIFMSSVTEPYRHRRGRPAGPADCWKRCLNDRRIYWSFNPTRPWSSMTCRCSQS